MARVVVVEAGSAVRVIGGGVFVVTRDGRRVPLTGEVEQVIIASGGVSLTAAALRRLAAAGVDVVVLDSRGWPVGRLYPPVVNKTVSARVGQYEAPPELKASIAVELVAAKIWNQGAVLRYIGKSRREEWLRERGYEVERVAYGLERLALDGPGWEDRLRAVEAHAARLYWDSVANLVGDAVGFEGRDQDGADPLNLALNYGYGILYGVCEKALTVAGLDPYMGVFHALKSGRPSLTLDFMEPFRPVAVDLPLVLAAAAGKLSLNLTPGGLLDYSSRRLVAGLVLESLDGRKVASGKRRRKAVVSSHVKWEAWDLAASFRERTPYEGWRVRL